MKLFSLKNISHLIFLTMSVSLVWYIAIANFAPFGISEKYSYKEGGTNISPLGPNNRITLTKINNDEITQQNEDIIYFTTKMPFQFDTAIFKMIYQNDSPDQKIEVGFKDQQAWHYNTRLFDSPLISSLEWFKVGEDPVLYQQSNTYKSVDSFLNNLPKNEMIGLYDFEKELLDKSTIKIPNYRPQMTDTVIKVPLRGAHTLYAYVEKEPFKMKIEKQDINWYVGEDAVSIRIYKDEDIVYAADIGDDGITDNSHRTTPVQEVTIRNPGPGLPENGVYKIVIDSGNDSIIKKITTNLNKIVIANSIFLAGNHDVYPNVIDDTEPSTIFTAAPSIAASTYHNEGIQEITLNGEKQSVDYLNKELVMQAKANMNKITIPKNDLLLEAPAGYFSFDENGYFSPTRYQLTQINDISDVDRVDYILSSYNSETVTDENQWRTTKVTFDLKNAVITDGRLSWLIKAPGLKENNAKILIKNIEIELIKKSILNK